MYAAPQAGDPILADLGEPSPVRTLLVYSVCGDFAPADNGSRGLRADAGILAGREEEQVVRKALRSFASQARVMENTLARGRDRRKGPEGYLELYQRARVRQPIDHGPYFKRLR
jgi:hypothetical protein